MVSLVRPQRERPCIGGRGFGVRREDIEKMLLATRGKVFTLKTMDRLVECSRLKELRTKQAGIC